MSTHNIPLSIYIYINKENHPKLSQIIMSADMGFLVRDSRTSSSH